MKLIDDKIIENLSESLGLKFMPEEKRGEILTMILELASKRAGIRIVENLSEQEVDEFENIPKTEFEKIEDFLISKNPNAQNIFAEEIEKTKEDILNSKINIGKNEQQG